MNALMTVGHPRLEHKFLAPPMPREFSQLCSKDTKRCLCFLCACGVSELSSWAGTLLSLDKYSRAKAGRPPAGLMQTRATKRSVPGPVWEAPSQRVKLSPTQSTGISL